MTIWSRGTTPPNNDLEALGAYIMFDANPYSKRHPPFTVPNWYPLPSVDLAGNPKIKFRDRFMYTLESAVLLRYGYLDVDGARIDEEVLIAYGIDKTADLPGYPLTDSGAASPPDTEVLAQKICDSAPTHSGMNRYTLLKQENVVADWLHKARKDFRKAEWGVKVLIHGQRPDGIDVEKTIVIPVCYKESGMNPHTRPGILAVGYVGGGAY